MEYLSLLILGVIVVLAFLAWMTPKAIRDKLGRKLDKEQLESLLREAEQAHAKYEQKLGRHDEDWPAWYAKYIITRLEK